MTRSNAFLPIRLRKQRRHGPGFLRASKPALVIVLSLLNASYPLNTEQDMALSPAIMYFWRVKMKAHDSQTETSLARHCIPLFTLLDKF